MLQQHCPSRRLMHVFMEFQHPGAWDAESTAALSRSLSTPPYSSLCEALIPSTKHCIPSLKMEDNPEASSSIHTSILTTSLAMPASGSCAVKRAAFTSRKRATSAGDAPARTCPTQRPSTCTPRYAGDGGGGSVGDAGIMPRVASTWTDNCNRKGQCSKKYVSSTSFL